MVGFDCSAAAHCERFAEAEFEELSPRESRKIHILMQGLLKLLLTDCRAEFDGIAFDHVVSVARCMAMLDL
jgi:hypothetical protein